MPSIKLVRLCCGIALLISAPGLTETPPSDACSSPRSTIEVNRCAQQEFDTQDRALNEAYQKVLSQLNTDYRQATRERLIIAQRLWIQFRDADCAAQESVYRGGTVHTAVLIECLRDHTAQRIKDLNPLAWQGG